MYEGYEVKLKREEEADEEAGTAGEDWCMSTADREEAVEKDEEEEEDEADDAPREEADQYMAKITGSTKERQRRTMRCYGTVG